MMDQKYYQKKLFMFGAILLVIGGLNWGVVALTGGDLVTGLFGRGSVIARAIFLAVALAAVTVVFRRDFYLPFLGETVMPCSVLADQTPEGADTQIDVKVTPGAKVLFWAAEPANEDLKELQDYRGAYLQYRNAGVTTADATGHATLKVRVPQPYTVPMRGELASHIHYRVCGDAGFMGPVRTIQLDGTEMFTNYVSREEQPESVQGPDDFAYVKPSMALAEVNAVVAETAANNLMAESGALSEAPRPGGAELDAAFTSPLA